MKLKRYLILSLVAVTTLIACGEGAPPLSAQVGSSSDYAATKGSPSAPVTIIIYSDFQCPACAKNEAIVKEILDKYQDKVYLIFRPYPLPVHRHGFTSAVAAECAKQQDKFWAYHDLLFDRQYDWGQNLVDISVTDPSNKFSQYAAELGLNVDQFNQCLQSDSAKQAVMSSSREGDDLQIASTPTIFIGSRRIVGPLSLKATYDSAIQEALRKAKR